MDKEYSMEFKFFIEVAWFEASSTGIFSSSTTLNMECTKLVQIPMTVVTDLTALERYQERKL